MENLVAVFDNEGEYDLEFQGNNPITILNSSSLNLNAWKFEVEFSFSDVDNGCFIFDKRNGQWHRNYCFGFLTPLWFEHHESPLKAGNYLFVDVGDGSQIQHELTNGLAVPAALMQGVTYKVVAGYDGRTLSMYLVGSDHSYDRIIQLGSIMGNGPLIIGSAGDPYQMAWPEYGLGPFKGRLEYLKFWEIPKVEGE